MPALGIPAAAGTAGAETTDAGADGEPLTIDGLICCIRTGMLLKLA